MRTASQHGRSMCWWWSFDEVDVVVTIEDVDDVVLVDDEVLMTR
jgi:hypothetical protein